MKTNLKVALHMSKLSVADKISTAAARVSAIAANPSVFVNAAPLLASVTAANNALEQAWKDAKDGGPSKKAIMHDKEEVLMKWMNTLAHYVEEIANGDEAVAHLAGMQVFTPGHKHIPDFDVRSVGKAGSVMLRVKAQKKALYKWQYCSSADPGDWVTAFITDVSRTVIGALESGKMYWFRVIVISSGGETPQTPVNFVVH